MSRIGAVELGGTKTLAAVGNDPTGLDEILRITTTTPVDTLGQVVDWLRSRRVESVGVSAFGPVELRPVHPEYGRIRNTPKPGWSGADIVGSLREALGVPVAVDTDVNGAALGEWRWGAGSHLNSFTYMTVGTGIGGAAIINGLPVGGLGHPEMGHVRVERHPQDDFSGRCPYHGNCLEGMACGPSLVDRFGPLEGWVDSEKVLDLVTYYLAQGLQNMVYSFAPQRIIVGGGVSKMSEFHHRLHEALIEALAGYPGLSEYQSADFITAPELGELSGLAGGLVIAGLGE